MIRCFFIVWILMGNVQLCSQTADEIIARHLEQSGGEQNWNKLSSIRINAQAVFGVQKPINIQIEHKKPYLKKVVYLVEGKELLSEGYDGDKGWTYSETLSKNIRIPGYRPDAFEQDLLNYKRKGFKVKLLGAETKNGKICHMIRLTKNVNTIDYCFAKDSYELIWEKNKDETISYASFKYFKGLKFATEMQATTKEGGEYGLYFESVVINPNLEKRKFRFKP